MSDKANIDHKGLRELYAKDPIEADRIFWEESRTKIAGDF